MGGDKNLLQSKMKLFVAALASAQANSMLKRNEKILGHLDRLVEMSLDFENKKDTRHIEKIQRWASRVVDANDRDGEKCDATVDAADDITVFDGEDPCKLNSQIMSALRSFARKFACNGRGNVPRQIRRRSRRLEENFVRRKFCDTAPETTETPTAPPTEPPTETPTEQPTELPIDQVIYFKSPESMSYSEAITYCYEQGMELAVRPHYLKNRFGYDHFHKSITLDLEDTVGIQKAWVKDLDAETCSLVTFNKPSVSSIVAISYNLHTWQYAAAYPDGCDTNLQAICMTGEYQTTSQETTTSNY